jgi:hypothetical protein
LKSVGVSLSEPLGDAKAKKVSNSHATAELLQP